MDAQGATESSGTTPFTLCSSLTSTTPAPSASASSIAAAFSTSPGSLEPSSASAAAGKYSEMISLYESTSICRKTVKMTWSSYATMSARPAAKGTHLGSIVRVEELPGHI